MGSQLRNTQENTHLELTFELGAEQIRWYD